ncbi:MAG: BON domain-containing protein [Nevskia sp.]|nr:BON domain-containing protein [Nevskia sp.]
MNKLFCVGCLMFAGALAPPLALALGPDDPDTDRSHPGAFVDDSAITAKIKTKLAADHLASLAKIHVDTDRAGVVVLSGTAHSQKAAEQAEVIARNTDGVRAVHNAIVVKRDD